MWAPRCPPAQGDDWRARAACTGKTEIMFSLDPDETEEARRVCARCPVVEPCLAEAIEDRSLVGMWGGTTEDERRAMRRKRRAA